MPRAATARVRRHGGRVSGDIPLPGVLAEIAEVAGRDAAIAVALAYGGDWLHIPAPTYLSQHPDHGLVGAAGKLAASAIAGRFRGGSIYVPIARRACAVALAQQGVSNSDIAERLRTSKKTVRRYLR